MGDPFENFDEKDIERYIDSRSGGKPQIVMPVIKTPATPSLDMQFGGQSGAIASIIAESAEVAAKRKETANKARDTFNALIDAYNKKFGLNVKLNYDNLTESLRVLSDPSSPHVLRALQLYTSQIYSAFRSVIYAKFIQSIMVLASDVLDPENLLNENLSFEAKIITIEKLIGFMSKIQSISGSMVIKGDDIELEKLSQDMLEGKLDQDANGLNTAEVREALRLLKDSFSTHQGEVPSESQ